MVPEDKIKEDLKECLHISKIKKNQVNKLLNNITISDSMRESFKGVDAIVIITNWEEFSKYDWEKHISSSKKSLFIFDGRNVINKNLSTNVYSLGN